MSVTQINPIVTTEDIRLALNGTYNSGTEVYTFWGVELTSGSVLAQINLANYFLWNTLGESVMTSTDSATYYHVRTCELDYSAMRVLTVLSGDVITDGFEFTMGITVRQPLLMAAYRNLIDQFKESAQMHLKALMPIALRVDSDVTTYRETAPSIF